LMFSPIVSMHVQSSLHRHSLGSFGIKGSNNLLSCFVVARSVGRLVA